MFITPKFFYDLQQPNNNGGNSEVLVTKEQIDKRNELRRNQGLEALPYPAHIQQPTPQAAAPEAKESLLDKFKKETVDKLKSENTDGKLTEEEITNEAEKLIRAEADRIKAEQDKQAEEARKKADAEKTETEVVKIQPKTPVKVTAVKEEEKQEDEVDEAALLKMLSKKAGKEITSLDEILNPKVEVTPEMKEQQAQERENAKLNFGLQNKKISKQEIEAFIADTKNPIDVAFNFYADTQREIDDTLTDKEIRESFEETYGLNEDEDSAKYKLGQKQLNFIANNLINQKHAKYLGLENEYSAFEKQQEETSKYQKEILAKAPLYKKDVLAVAERVGKINIAGYEVELDKSIIDGYVAKMLEPEYTEKIISQGYTLEGIESAMRNSAILENFDEMINGVLEADRLKHQAGLRGIVPPQNKAPQKVFGEKQEEERKALQQRLGMTAN